MNNSFELRKLTERIPGINDKYGDPYEEMEKTKKIVNERIRDYISITQCREFSKQDIEHALGIDNYYKTMEITKLKFYVDEQLFILDEIENIIKCVDDNKEGLTGEHFIVLDSKEKKEQAKKQLDKSMSESILDKYEKDLLLFTTTIEPNIWWKEVELKALFYDYVNSNNYCDDPGVTECLYEVIIGKLIKRGDLVTDIIDENKIVYAALNDDGKAKFEEEQLQKENKKIEIAKTLVAEKIKEARKLFQFAGNSMFSNNKEVRSIKTAWQSNSVVNNAYSIEEFEELLYWCVYDGLLEYSTRTFAKPGVRLQNLEKRRDDYIKNLEALKNEESVILATINDTKKQIAELENVYLANKNKIFGQGAKLKKEAQAKIPQLETVVQTNTKNLGNLKESMKKIDQDLFPVTKLIESVQEGKTYDTDSKKIIDILKKQESPLNAKMIIRLSKNLYNKEDEKKVTNKLESMKTSKYVLSVKVEDESYYVPIFR